MRAELIPQSNGSTEIFRRKAEQTIQHSLDRLQSGGNPILWGGVLRTIGTSWCDQSSENDMRIFL